MGNSLYKQVHGIPMGTDCAPQLANLFLHSLEYKYVINNITKNPSITNRLKHTFRYIDDLTVINGSAIMDKISKDIYPSYLQLVRVNTDLMS